LPLYIPTHQPCPPARRADRDEMNIEPVYMTIKSWEPRVRRNGTTDTYGGEYLTMWYVGQIPDDAVGCISRRLSLSLVNLTIISLPPSRFRKKGPVWRMNNTTRVISSLLKKQWIAFGKQRRSSSLTFGRSSLVQKNKFKPKYRQVSLQRPAIHRLKVCHLTFMHSSRCPDRIDNALLDWTRTNSSWHF